MAWQFCIYLPSKLSQTFRYKPLNSLRTSLSSRFTPKHALIVLLLSYAKSQQEHSSRHWLLREVLRFSRGNAKLLLNLSNLAHQWPMLWLFARTALLLPVVVPLESELRHLCTVPFTSQLQKDTRHLWLSKKFRSHKTCINELTILFHPAAALVAKCQCFYFYDTSSES